MHLGVAHPRLGSANSLRSGAVGQDLKVWLEQYRAGRKAACGSAAVAAVQGSWLDRNQA